eukprot:7375912-Prymnesium_polylepis.1
MSLSRDPRLRPDDITVTTDHMSACTSCTNYEGLRGVLHPDGIVDFGTDRQLLVDDWPIDSWMNIVRFLNAPTSKAPVLDTDDDDDARFGCPCSVLPTQSPGVPMRAGGTPDGGQPPRHTQMYNSSPHIWLACFCGLCVMLIHSSGVARGDNVNKYRMRTSPNGVDLSLIHI